MSKKKRVIILGSTGEVGRTALRVIQAHPNLFEVAGLAANDSVDLLVEQIKVFKPQTVAMSNPTSAKALRKVIAELDRKDLNCLEGSSGVATLAGLPADLVIAGIVGMAGLAPVLEAAKAGRTILLANKEALVSSGSLLLKLVDAHGATLVPIDTEHNALYQCLPPLAQKQAHALDWNALGIRSLVLTASGGPLREWPIESLRSVPLSAVLKHPNWTMGPKISVDSATMVNKGLELLEAKWLFNAPTHGLEAVIHPSSIIHGLIEFIDGNIKALLSKPDLIGAMGHAMGLTVRLNQPENRIQLTQLPALTFEPINPTRYPSFALAQSLLTAPQGYATAFNAANEVVVNAFLSRKLEWFEIHKALDEVIQRNPWTELCTLEEVYACDAWARRVSMDWIAKERATGTRL